MRERKRENTLKSAREKKGAKILPELVGVQLMIHRMVHQGMDWNTAARMHLEETGQEIEVATL